jgi:hypothetical protein
VHLRPQRTAHPSPAVRLRRKSAHSLARTLTAGLPPACCDVIHAGHSFLLVRRHRYTRELSFYRCHSATPVALADLVAVVCTKWRIEVTFAEARDLLRAGRAQSRTRAAVERTAPFGRTATRSPSPGTRCTATSRAMPPTAASAPPWYTAKTDSWIRKSALSSRHGPQPASTQLPDHAGLPERRKSRNQVHASIDTVRVPRQQPYISK